MQGKQTDQRTVNYVLRLLRAGMSKRTVARLAMCSFNTVQKIAQDNKFKNS